MRHLQIPEDNPAYFLFRLNIFSSLPLFAYLFFPRKTLNLVVINVILKSGTQNKRKFYRGNHIQVENYEIPNLSSLQLELSQLSQEKTMTSLSA